MEQISTGVDKLRKLFLIFNHKLTDEQKSSAFHTLKVDDIIYQPDDLQEIWSNVPPEGDFPEEEIKKVVIWLSENSAKGDYVLIQGDFGATFYLVDYSLKMGLIPVYATSKRTVLEERDEHGVTKKVSIFKHVEFRRYRYFS